MPCLAPLCATLVFFGLWCGTGLVIDALAEPPSHGTSGSPIVEMHPGLEYAPGTRISISKGHASFVVPDGWHAQLPEDSETIILVSESGVGFGMVMALNMTEEEMIGLMGEPQPMTHDMVFEPAGPVLKKGNRVTASYEAGPLTGRAVTVLGPTQQGVLFFLGRLRTEVQEPDRLLDELATSTEFVVSH
jgi:hypothetical protein